jgi:hypothetical protein
MFAETQREGSGLFFVVPLRHNYLGKDRGFTSYVGPLVCVVSLCRKYVIWPMWHAFKGRKVISRPTEAGLAISIALPSYKPSPALLKRGGCRRLCFS